MRKAHRPTKIIRVEDRPSVGAGTGPVGVTSEPLNLADRDKAFSKLIEIVDNTSIENLTPFAVKFFGEKFKTADKDRIIDHIAETFKTVSTIVYITKELEAYLEIIPKVPKVEPAPIPEPKPGPEPTAGGSPETEPEPSSDEKLLAQITQYLKLEFDVSKDDPIEYMKTNFELTEEQIQDILARLKACEVSVEHVNDDLATLEQYCNKELYRLSQEIETLKKGGGVVGEYHIKYPTGEVKNLKKILPTCFPKLLDLATTRDNIFLAGPTQCGKTTTAELVAEALELRFSSLSCSEGMDESLFAGTLLPVGVDGKFEYVPSTFVDFYENGGVFLLDEFCASDSNLSIFINNALGNDHFFLPRRYMNPRVQKHKDFICIAADNTLGHGGDDVYVGRNQLDASTLERFRTGFIVMDYSKAVEKLISDPEVYDWCIMVRQAIKALSLKRHMTTRTMKRFTIMKRERNWTLADMQSVFFADWEKPQVELLLNKIKRDLEGKLPPMKK